MRLRSTLFEVALLATTAGCGGVFTTNEQPDAGKPGGEAGADAAEEPACGGCNCGKPAVPSGNATPDQACQITHDIVTGGSNQSCETFCAALNHTANGSGFYCTVPQSYVTAYMSVQGDAGGSDAGDGDAGDAGPANDAGADAAAGPVCPAWTGDVLIECGYACLGRRTEGLRDPEPHARDDATLGALFADRAYLEAVSVYAFARLERELAAHGAPASLLRAAGRARRDEIRHAAVTARLARRYGAGTPRLPEAPAVTPVRSLFDVALENAVEGCIRETYGAVVGIVEARASSDTQVRQAMRGISADECRHAELAWDIAAWILPRLTAEERAAVRRGMRDAVAALARDGNARIVELLEARVWSAAA